MTPWICAPLLFIGALFGVLLLTGTTIREVPDTLRAMFHTRMFDYDDEGEYYEDDEPESVVAEDFSDGYYDDASAYGDDGGNLGHPVTRRSSRTTSRRCRSRW